MNFYDNLQRSQIKIQVSLKSFIQSNQNNKDLIRNNFIQKEDIPFIVTEPKKKDCQNEEDFCSGDPVKIVEVQCPTVKPNHMNFDNISIEGHPTSIVEFLIRGSRATLRYHCIAPTVCPQLKQEINLTSSVLQGKGGNPPLKTVQHVSPTMPASSVP
ncbi:hypothetical protein CEXT_644621 [Caerostris extrusa]|uniref:Uncharacterized protein n=1 Tax=Caerostris extrusa TaxID=172846 RepID=A0AAV4R6J1_CAEEX|nr:hypothetical protein CEXT_644621 [Caerostris extrusa]